MAEENQATETEVETTETETESTETEVETKGEDKKADGADTELDADDWRASIEDGTVRKFASRYTTPADLAKAALEQRQQLGKAIQVPGKDADEKAVKTFHKAIGVPDEPKGYDLAPPDDISEEVFAAVGGQARLDAFAEIAHKAGVSATGMKALAQAYFDSIEDDIASVEQAQKEQREQTETELRREWGGDYERNMNLAKRALDPKSDIGQALGLTEEFAVFLEQKEVDGVILGDHPIMAKVWATMARRFGEDKPASMLMDDKEKDSVQERIDEIHKMQYDDPDKYRSAPIQKELGGLYSQLHGNQSITDAEGRSTIR